MELNLENAISVAIMTVGLTQAIKNFLKDKDVPAWVYTLLMCGLSCGCAAAIQYLPPFVADAIKGISISQLGYETIVQTLQKLPGMLKPNGAESSGEK